MIPYIGYQRGNTTLAYLKFRRREDTMHCIACVNNQLEGHTPLDWTQQLMHSRASAQESCNNQGSSGGPRAIAAERGAPVLRGEIHGPPLPAEHCPAVAHVRNKDLVPPQEDYCGSGAGNLVCLLRQACTTRCHQLLRCARFCLTCVRCDPVL